MAKTLVEHRIAGRADRKRLDPSSTPYWRSVDPDVHLGYRKGARGGTWLVRWRIGTGYRQARLGTADDELHEGTMSFDAAIREARSFVERARASERAAARGAPTTVGSAAGAYIAKRDARHKARSGNAVRSDANHRLTKYVVGKAASGRRAEIDRNPLADVELHALKESQLRKWLNELPSTLKEATKRRLINDLRAALNEAYTTDRDRLPPALPEILKNGLRLDVVDFDRDPIARENQILNDAQISRIVVVAREVDVEQGWEGDLYHLILVLAATGSRFSQIARVRVGDFLPDEARLMVPFSYKGKRERGGETPVPLGTDVVRAIKAVAAGRAASEPLLQRWRSKQAPGGIRWVKESRGPWQLPTEIVRAWGLIRTRVGLPDIVPYSLRHSSIVRGIRANLPIRLVAELHDTSVAMIERHYGRYIASGFHELAARAVVQIVHDR
ncbi:tyrosine-type recombinase/integrase [Sphingomonas sp. LR60]|uniref:integrase n=1 Tax=Sphingomonas sp. LR60 TaxID=3050233 RepID=UPI002FE34A66